MKSHLNNRLKKSVVFQGGYDGQNAGDDAFAAICAWGAKHYWQTEQIKFLKKNLPVLSTESQILLHENPRCHLQTVAEMTYQISTNPILIFGGGSVFFQAGGGVWKLCNLLSKIGKLKVGAIGVSLGPYRSKQDRQAVQEVLKHFSFLVLRDSASYADACDMNLPYEPVEGFDLAALLPQVYPLAPLDIKKEKPVIGISVCHYEQYVEGDLRHEEAREKKLIEMLKIISQETQVCLRFIVFNGNYQKGDLAVSEMMADKLREYNDSVEIFPYSNNPHIMWKAIADCDMMIATRLHSGIFSYMAEVPFVQIEYHKKCTDFLDVIGYPAGYRFGDFEISSVEGAQRALSVLKINKLKYQKDKSKLIEKAESNFTSLISKS